MSMLNITNLKQKDAVNALQKAMVGGNESEIQEAWSGFQQSIIDVVKQDFEDAHGNQTILAQRGYRQLTPEETNYYNKLIEAGKTSNPKQSFAGMTEIMPETIIEDVYKDLIEEHPLLSKINFVSVKYLTKWILNDHTVQTAVWGEINSAITEEITSAFRVVDVNQCKLSAFAVIEKDMLDLGPVFLDGYIRMFLRDALLCGLEKGIVDGTGKDMPIGLTRDISENVTITGGVYPKKEKIKVDSFAPVVYGDLLARMVKNEKGRNRKFQSVLLICNQSDYLRKVMPATTVLNGAGAYVNNLFPFPTETVISNELSDGEAILCLPEEYFMGIGGAKEGVIEYSDDLKFLEDKRVYKIKTHGMGKGYDNTISILIDITDLDPAYITVKSVEAATPVVSAKKSK
ncbi:MAG: phage major capsid protein [Clostridium sp.]